ncbi:MAG: deoxyguanosinetriphosphate triphosphohydrolase [Ruminococcus sp.]|nr:deoxyguanosinetriphosphate triphosphohydrolase [Ruminococcus sp.]
MKWSTLLCAKRMRGGYGTGSAGKAADLRSEFEKDYHRIIGSASFRRLQDKTQVFPLDKSDFIRTRLTHSLEVSSFGKSLGQNIGQNILTDGLDSDFTPQMKEDLCHILQCAGLIHDIGNPPFGHFGEMAIREWFKQNLSQIYFYEKPLVQWLEPQMKEDFYHFEGNAQALRLVTKLHYLVDENGMNLTYALLNTIVKYPVPSTGINKKTGNCKDKKMGYYYADRAVFEEITRETGTFPNRHPLTYILEAADDLAYTTADIEDAFVKGYISYYLLEEELGKLEAKFEHPEFPAQEKLRTYYRRGVEKGLWNPQSYAVKNWIVRLQGYLISCATSSFTLHYGAIMNGEYKEDLFAGTYGGVLIDMLGDLAYEKVFCSNDIYKMEIAEGVILDFLMNKLVKAVLYYDTGRDLTSTDIRVISFISDNYLNAYRHQAKGKSEAEKLYLRLLLVTDYVCGMTDSYAKRLYQELKGII